MADVSSSPATIDPNTKQPESENPNHKSDPPTTSAPPPEQQQQQQLQQQQQSSILNPNPNQTPSPASLPLPPVQSYAPPQQPIPVPPSYRPVPIPQVLQFSPVQSYQSPGMVQPPGVGVSGVVGTTVPPPMMPYPVVPGQLPNMAPRPYTPMPNGYAAVPAPAPGLPRYPAPYPAMVRPAFPPRPPGSVGVLPAVARLPVPGIPGVRPIIPPVVRPVVLPTVTPAEKPQTTVYVGKIAPTADNDFMLSVLQVCGPVKSWKRAQDPSNGSLRGFGFYEFESAEGVLRALRLLNKFNIDGQELMLNVNQATKEYLKRYVQKKTENTKKLKETQDEGAGKENETVQSVENTEPTKPSEDLKKDNETINKENNDTANLGIVTDEDKEADREALEKLKSMIEERLKIHPLPPPPPATPDGSRTCNLELPAKTRDGDFYVDGKDSAEDKIDDESTSDTKGTSDHDRPQTSSPDRSRVHDRRSRDRERDLKREKEREIDRYEREAERERVRKEREQRRKIEEAEREYERCLKDWEYREREKEKERQYEKEREKERERKRKKEIVYDEEEDDDDSRKRWRRSVLEEKRRKRLREKDDDLADRLKEEEEMAEARRRAEEEHLQQQQRDALKLLSAPAQNGSEKTVLDEESSVENNDKAAKHDFDGGSIRENEMASNEVLQNGTGDESTDASVAVSDMRQSGNAPARKLGFGLVGSGKRTAVPSVFREEDDDADKEKKMRHLVPIDYSTEELQAAQPIVSGANPPNLAAAAEFAKRISNVNPKDEKPDAERERSRRSYDRSSLREKDRSDEDSNRTRDENKEKILDRDRDREHVLDKVKTADNKKLLDAKQLIDMIPKTKEELFSYEINWAVYDKHALHERMRPWISKKITEFLGEEESTLVDYIVSSTREHVKAPQMLELLQSILDDEAEMFVLKMWRMLIFEIKKVETGLALRSKS